MLQQKFFLKNLLTFFETVLDCFRYERKGKAHRMDG